MVIKLSTKPTIIHPVFSKILSHFPQNFTFCFAYGSAVKKQTVSEDRTPMVDLIFCVNNPKEWHSQNLLQNRNHYSSLRLLGRNFIAKYQENFGAKVYYNTLVKVNGHLIKYGVVSTKDLVRDLLEWSYLYLAGRLHKPVEILRQPTSVDLQTALQLNLRSAVHAALLHLPDTFTDYEFFHALANLSYSGDFRMYFGENRQKIDNIVRAQIGQFRSLYLPIIQRHFQEYAHFPTGSGDQNQCAQDTSSLARYYHLNQLPRWPQKYLTRFWNKGHFRQDTEDVLRAIAFDPDCSVLVQNCINGIVWQSSVRQSVKGILTAGAWKTLRYSSRKIAKMIP